MGFLDYESSVHILKAQQMVANYQERILPILPSIKVKMGKIPSHPLQFSRVKFLFISDDVGLGWVLGFFLSSMSSSLIRANQMPRISRGQSKASGYKPDLALTYWGFLLLLSFKEVWVYCFYTRSVICSQPGKTFTSLNSAYC